MKLHDHHEEGPPCRSMEGLLQRTADGSARGLARWYALAHAARCGRCARFLQRLEATLVRLRATKESDPPAAVQARLASGPWREE
jgi:hypothetical protein